MKEKKYRVSVRVILLDGSLLKELDHIIFHACLLGLFFKLHDPLFVCTELGKYLSEA